MSSYVSSDFSGMDKLLKSLTAKKYIKAGVIEGGTYDNGETVAGVAAQHEFGLGVPQRSIIKMPLMEKSSVIENYVAKNWTNNIVSGNTEQIYLDLGIAAVSVIADAFDTGGFGKWEELSPVTIEAKGSNAILQDIGQLKKSITYVIGG